MAAQGNGYGWEQGLFDWIQGTWFFFSFFFLAATTIYRAYWRRKEGRAYGIMALFDGWRGICTLIQRVWFSVDDMMNASIKLEKLVYLLNSIDMNHEAFSF
jgi:hypothetical protein